MLPGKSAPADGGTPPFAPRRASRRPKRQAIQDVRNVSGSLERFLIDRGETVVRLAQQLMAGARRGARTRGKSDPIDALAIARTALREGVENLPTARLAGPEREIRQLALYRERLLDMRTRLSNELRWQ